MNKNTLEVVRLRIENHTGHALGIGEAKPRLSWSFAGSARNWIQHAYEVEVQRPGTFSTFTVKSSLSSFVPWPDQPLASSERATVRVRVRGKANEEYSPWSDSIDVETGLLERSCWNASCLIEPDLTDPVSAPLRPVLFQKKFNLASPARCARLYITAHGVYEAQINGIPIGDQVLAPGWTSYKHRLLYQTFNVTDILKQGDNYLCVEVAEGWYAGRLGFMGGRSCIWGNSLGLIALLKIEDRDGLQHLYGTDSSWEWRHTATLQAGIYDGETYDQRLEKGGDSRLGIVKSSVIEDNLLAIEGPPIRRAQELLPVDIFRSKSDRLIIDIGQNVVGRLRIRVTGPKDTTIVIRHAEVMENGELSTRPLRDAKATDSVTLSGNGLLVWEPRFTFHGFRYVEISGWPGEIREGDIVAVVIHSDMQKTGSFICSNPLLNKLHENITWSMRGNFVGVPTDCPQRDERLGWTGDIAIFSPTASFLYDTSGMLRSWLQDLSAEQIFDHDGTVPVVVPNVLPNVFNDEHAIWGDASIMVPWSLYMASGDISILSNQYNSMVAWLDKIPRKSSRLWHYKSKWKLGDWLDPTAPANDSGAVSTDPNLVSDAFLYHVTTIVATVAQLLGKDEDHARYHADSQAIREAFTHEYVTAAGRIVGDTQTALALAIQFDLFDTKEQQAHAAERLSYLIRRNARFSIATGFAGTPYVGHALTKTGMSNIFYRMLLHRKAPSWLYPVTMGATTMWERWDSMLPDGTVNPGWMTSFNHYALGSVASWLHSAVAGLQPVNAGWSTFRVAPNPGGTLKWAQARYVSAFGVCAVRWTIANSAKEGYLSFSLKVKVPLNSRAEILLPGDCDIRYVGSGIHSWIIPYEADSWPPRAEYPPFMNQDDELPVDEIVGPDAGCDAEWLDESHYVKL